MPRFIQSDIQTKQGNLITNTSYLPAFGTQFSIIQQKRQKEMVAPPIIVHSNVCAHQVPFLPRQCRCSSLFYHYNDGRISFYELFDGEFVFKHDIAYEGGDIDYVIGDRYVVTLDQKDTAVDLQRCEEDINFYICVNSHCGRRRDCYFTVSVARKKILVMYLNDEDMLEAKIVEHDVLERLMFMEDRIHMISMRVHGHSTYKDVIIFKNKAFFLASNGGVPFLVDEYLSLQELPNCTYRDGTGAIYKDSVLHLFAPNKNCIYGVSELGIHTDSTCTVIEQLMSGDEELFMYSNGEIHRMYVTKARPSTVFTVNGFNQLYKLRSKASLIGFATKDMYALIDPFSDNMLVVKKGLGTMFGKQLVSMSDKVYVQQFEQSCEVYNIQTHEILFSISYDELHNDGYFKYAVATENHLLIDGYYSIMTRDRSVLRFDDGIAIVAIQEDVGFIASRFGVTALFFNTIGGYSSKIVFDVPEIRILVTDPWASHNIAGFCREGIVQFVSFDFESGSATGHTLERLTEPKIMQFIAENILVIDDEVFKCSVDKGFELLSATLPYENSVWICNRQNGAIRINRAVTNHQISGNYISYNSNDDSLSFEPFYVRLLDFLQNCNLTVLDEFSMEYFL
ncbi:hypothetical protein PCE1_002541 [Barthelona sp. PCE]